MKASRRWAKWLVALACAVSFALVPVSAGAGGAKMWEDPRELVGEPDIGGFVISWIPSGLAIPLGLAWLDLGTISLTRSGPPSPSVRQNPSELKR